ncbi:uncharacterized protein LOC130893539 [Diorhabda carinulata]|uniref:uncharacterized protein LOC130893539 n=1 Tax=Diorhabda carinulata TaxID=1163345 RepID=UPI0025A0DA45|nr:uncharacterized protein LOC130893539 [Diorhabda carinulata]
MGSKLYCVLRNVLMKRRYDVEFVNSGAADIQTPLVQEKRLFANAKKGFYNSTDTKSKHPTEKAMQQTHPNICPVKKKKIKKEKKRIWSRFTAEEIEKKRKAATECGKQCEEFNRIQEGPDLDLCHLGDRVFRTCGTAYVIQKNMICETKIPEWLRRENALVDRMEVKQKLKDFKDPLPEFKSVAQRLVDLADKKLHPLYKKYLFTTQKSDMCGTPEPIDKSKFGYVKGKKTFLKCRFNKEILERKNIYVDFKRIEAPGHVLAKFFDNQMDKKHITETKNPPVHANSTK